MTNFAATSRMPREFAIHFARAMLAEAAKRRHSHACRHFYWILIEMAQSARKDLCTPAPTQGDLFA